MEITVKITQVREGFVKIECDDFADAIAKAEELYNVQGKELPDMEDAGPLHFMVYGKYREKEAEPAREGPLSFEEAERYMTALGFPNPGEADTGWLLHGGDRQAQCTEAVRNNYYLGDVDRWFHLMDILGNDISFRAAMLIDNAIWEKTDSDAMEVNNLQEIIEASEGEIESRLEYLNRCINETGECPENPWKVTKQDVSILFKAFDPGNILPEAIVYRTTGSLKEALFDCSYEDGIQYCEEHNWEFKDENDFVWNLELDDLREVDKSNSLSAEEKESLFKALETATIIEYKGIRFDDWQADVENESVWAEMCQGCAEKFKDLISDELDDGSAIGTCSVDGCDVNGQETENAHHYYIDFKLEHIKVVESRSLETPGKDQPAVSDNKKPTLFAQIQSAEARAASAGAAGKESAIDDRGH